MTTTNGYCMVMTTCASADEAAALTARLLDDRLAACIQAIDVASSYVWQGERNVDPEKLLLIKTRDDLYESVEKTLRAIHPYETPEILKVPIAAGLPAYLAWMDEITTPPAATSASG